MFCIILFPSAGCLVILGSVFYAKYEQLDRNLAERREIANEESEKQQEDRFESQLGPLRFKILQKIPFV